MQKQLRLACALLALFVPVNSLAAEVSSCPFCDHRVTLTAPDADCLEQRLPDYLQAGSDPMIVSVLNCGGRPVDRSRTENLPEIPAITDSGSAYHSTNGARHAYLLSRADALCLLAHLKIRSRNAQPFVFDSGTC